MSVNLLTKRLNKILELHPECDDEHKNPDFLDSQNSAFCHNL